VPDFGDIYDPPLFPSLFVALLVSDRLLGTSTLPVLTFSISRSRSAHAVRLKLVPAQRWGRIISDISLLRGPAQFLPPEIFRRFA
jgi:hypothetical protein